jgi:hypothetical protein
MADKLKQQGRKCDKMKNVMGVGAAGVDLAFRADADPVSNIYFDE